MLFHNIQSSFATDRRDQNAIFELCQFPNGRRRFWRRILAETALRTYDRKPFPQRMIFCMENAGTWVASKGEKVVATGKTLTGVMRTVEARKNKASIRFDLVPKAQFLIGLREVSVR